MTGGESEAGSAGINALLLDFMRVIEAQHQLFYGSALDTGNAIVRIDLRHTSRLFDSLGLRTQSVNTQWMMIIKLYRLQCLKAINNFHYNGSGEWDAEGFLNYQFDYNLMDTDIELVLLPERFNGTIKDLTNAQPSLDIKPPATYSCKLHLRDNRVYLVINDHSFQVARPNSGSMIDDLLRQLEKLPSLEPLTAVDFRPGRDDIEFDRMLDKYKCRWLLPMLPVCESKVISIQNPAELELNQLLEILPNIAENYRQPIAQYLGIDSLATE